MGDHPPITPTSKVPYYLDDDNEKRIYEYIVRHFLGSISRNVNIMLIYIKIFLNGLTFQVTNT